MLLASYLRKVSRPVALIANTYQTQLLELKNLY